MAAMHGIDLPDIPDDLLAALDVKYPARCPDIHDNERLIWIKAGRREVVDYLADQRRRQQEANRTVGLDGFYLESGEASE